MKLPDLPPFQGKRFDIETLQYNAISLMKQADEAPIVFGNEDVHPRLSSVTLAIDLSKMPDA